MMDKEDFPNVTHYTHVDVQPGGINIQHVEHLHQADVLKALGIELEVKKKAAGQAPSWPEELKTEAAMVYWRRLQEAGFVNEDFSRNKMSRIQAMYIAKKFAFAMGLSATWKPFETGWGINNLAQEYRQKKDECKNIPRKEEIDRIFAT